MNIESPGALVRGRSAGGHGLTQTDWTSERIDVATLSASSHERVDYWREMILRLFADVEIGALAAPGFHGRVRSQKCDLLRVSDVSASAQSVNRRHLHARSRDEDKYFAVLMLQGQECLEQGGNRTVICPGEFSIYDATRPHFLNFQQDWRQIIVSLPRSSLNHLVPDMECRTATRVSLDTPTGRVLRSFLETLCAQVGEFSCQEMARLSESAVHLIALALGTVTSNEPEHSRSQALTLMRVKVYINDNLGDPTLGAEQVAMANGLSSRYIAKLFEREGSSLMRYVLRRRLERCAAELLNPLHAGKRISELAFALGFNDLSHFSRAFRAFHGVSPTEWREANGRNAR